MFQHVRTWGNEKEPTEETKRVSYSVGIKQRERFF